jgi:hypothetical protein
MAQAAGFFVSYTSADRPWGGVDRLQLIVHDQRRVTWFGVSLSSAR